MKCSHNVDWLAKKLALCAIILCCLILPIHAQQPCEEDCDPLTNPYTERTVTTTVSASCNVKLFVGVRACKGVWEVKVLRIEALGCNDIDINEVIRRTVSMTIVENLLLLPYPATWRVATPSCWNRSPKGDILPCDAPCCVSYLSVSRREDCNSFGFDGQRTHSVKPNCKVSPESPGGIGSEVPHSCWFSCYPVVPTLH
ncbi:MAG: hypothetical protein RIR53_1235 [Bacteroidota bacterium]|jgi:hypothetical protein